MKNRYLRLFLPIASLLFSCNLFWVESAHAQGKAKPCQIPIGAKPLNATLDDSERPTRLEMTNREACAKETVKFYFAPAESRTFPFNGQTFSSDDGVTITQTFQHNSKLDFSFGYTIGDKTLAIGVERLSGLNPETNRIRLLPVKMSIKFNGSSAAFVFTGQESEDELATKLQDFLAVGRLAAQAADFEKASQRISKFTKKLWISFARGDARRSALPLKASFPATEMTYNIFALSFALQNDAFERSKLCDNPKTLHQSLMVMAGVKESTDNQAARFSKVSFSSDTHPKGVIPSSRIVQDVEAEGRLCCLLCEIVHCTIDAHWADCLCCLLTCKPCLPILN